jgi:hypothetical protein
MSFGNLGDRLSQIKKDVASSGKFGGMVDEKVNALLEDYSNAVESLKTFGMKVGKLRLEMGLFPQISTSFRGSVDDLDPVKIQALLDASADKKLLTAILSAMLTVIRIRDIVDLKNSQSVVLDVTLGIPPKVTVELE